MDVKQFNTFHFFLCIEAECPSQQFFSHVRTEPTLPGFNQYCRESMCLAQGHNTVPLVGIEPRTSQCGVRNYPEEYCKTLKSQMYFVILLPLMFHRQTGYGHH